MLSRLVFFVLFLGSCQPDPSQSGTRAPEPVEAQTPPLGQSVPEPGQPTSLEIPVDADDAVWGAALAPVTIVVFTDLQCPFCGEAHPALTAIEREYGPERLRVVLKHLPLPMHEHALQAARIAQAILEIGGPDRVFMFVDEAYGHPDLIALGRFSALLQRIGLAPAEVEARAQSPEIGERVLSDVLLADRLKVPATPHYRINGVGLTGVQPAEAFQAVIEEELFAAKALVDAGTRADQVYSRRVASNITRVVP